MSVKDYKSKRGKGVAKAVESIDKKIFKKYLEFLDSNLSNQYDRKAMFTFFETNFVDK